MNLVRLTQNNLKTFHIKTMHLKILIKIEILMLLFLGKTRTTFTITQIQTQERPRLRNTETNFQILMTNPIRYLFKYSPLTMKMRSLPLTPNKIKTIAMQT